MTAWYLDTSAFVKLVSEETHSEAMREWLQQRDEAADRILSSDLLQTEAIRAARRTEDDEALQRTFATLDDIALVRVTPDTFETAALVDPPQLRSLDAIHIAMALSLGSDLGGLVAYDARLIDAARAIGITSVSPGLDP